MDLELSNISHSYGDVEVLRGIDLKIRHGEIVSIIGPSGCGKSTLLRLIGGLERPDSGQVLQVGDPPANSLNPLTYIFQDFALLPWRTVEGNVSLALEHHRLGRARKAEIIDDVLRRTNLIDFRKALPRQLSGRMRPRVAIARAPSVHPAVMLLGEPLSSLAALTRVLLVDDLLELWRKEAFTACYVTHNLAEAVRMGHRIVVLSRRPGRIRAIIEIEVPHAERKDNFAELERHQAHLWELMRDEARAAELELVDG